MRQIRVLVVDDSLVFRELLVACLKSDPAIEVVAAGMLFRPEMPYWSTDRMS